MPVTSAGATTMEAPLLLAACEEGEVDAAAARGNSEGGGRLREEWFLFQRQRGPIAGALLLLAYGALVVFRNLAYFRYRAGDRLRDAGFEAFAEFSPAELRYADAPIHLTYALDGVVFLGAVIGPSGVARLRGLVRLPARADGASDHHPHLVTIVRRMLCVYALGHTLRGFTYLSTTLPGSADHCLPGAALDPPRTLLECFYRVSSVNGNCGDLIFSGHMLFMWLSLGLIHRYGADTWGVARHGTAHVVAMSACVLLTLVQAIFILKARHHYTVDVVVATYTVPLLWHFYNSVVQPTDLKVDRAHIEKAIEADRDRPLWQRIALVIQTVLMLAFLVLALLVIVHGNFRFIGLGGRPASSIAGPHGW